MKGSIRHRSKGKWEICIVLEETQQPGSVGGILKL